MNDAEIEKAVGMARRELETCEPNFFASTVVALAEENERLKSEQRKIALDWFKADVTRSARTEGDAKNEV